MLDIDRLAACKDILAEAIVVAVRRHDWPLCDQAGAAYRLVDQALFELRKEARWTASVRWKRLPSSARRPN